jgi:hypothetical protein
MQKMDLKFSGIITKNKDNTVVPQDQWIVFLVKDDAFPATLKFYYDECLRLGAGRYQLEAIQELIIKVRTWRRNHSELCKVPDVEDGELITL